MYLLGKGKQKKWDYIKLKSFYTKKETINKMKRQSTEWENILANDTAEKGLTTKFIKNLYTGIETWNRLKVTRGVGEGR